MAEARAAGAIYDLGYQRYTGERGSDARTRFATLVHVFASARPSASGAATRSKIMPLLVMAIVFFPAIRDGIRRARRRTAETHQLRESTAVHRLLCSRCSRRRRRRSSSSPTSSTACCRSTSRGRSAAPTTRSRSSARSLAAMLVLTLGPQLLLFIGKVVHRHGAVDCVQGRIPQAASDRRRNAADVACFMASIGLSLASLASRRAYASAAVIVFFLLMPARRRRCSAP